MSETEHDIRLGSTTPTEAGVIIVTDGAVDLPEWLEDSPTIRRVAGGIWLGNDPVQGGTEQFWSSRAGVTNTLRQLHLPSAT